MTVVLAAAAVVVWVAIGLATTTRVVAPWMAREFPLTWADGLMRGDALFFGLFFWPGVLLFGLVIFVFTRLGHWMIDRDAA